jgi:hypothetical protein
MKRELTRKFHVPPREENTLTFLQHQPYFPLWSVSLRSFGRGDSVGGDGTQNFPVFDLLRDQLFSIFRMIPMFIQAWVSLDRVNDFLNDVSASLCSSRGCLR